MLSVLDVQIPNVIALGGNMHHRDISNAVKSGGCQQTYAHAPESPAWVAFARSMAPMMMMAAAKLAEIVVGNERHPVKVLDIAAGHGLFGIAVLRANPKAEVTAVDWKSVLEVALENANRFGVADRYETIPGSIFDVDMASQQSDQCGVQGVRHHPLAELEDGEMGALRRLVVGVWSGAHADSGAYKYSNGDSCHR